MSKKSPRSSPSSQATIHELFMQGYSFFQAGQFTQAEIACNNLLSVDSKHADAWLLLGMVAAYGNEFDRALTLINKSLALQPLHPYALLNQGNVLQAVARYEEAVASYDKALVVSPHLADAHYNRGLVLQALGRLQEAVKAYNEAILFESNHVDAHNNLGVILMELGHFQDAATSCERAIDIQPDFAQAHNNLGLIWQASKRLDLALACFDRAIELDAGFTDAHSNRGILLQEMGRLSEALESLAQALQTDPLDPEILYNQGNVLLEIGEPELAKIRYERALDLRPGYVKALNNLGLACQALGHFEKALEYFEQAILTDPTYADAHYHKGLLLLTLKRFEAGFYAYESRWQTQTHSSRYMVTKLPVWDGIQRVSNLLLWAEQGVGDQVFFASLASELADRSMSVTLTVDARLKSLMERAFPSFVVLPQNTLNSVDFEGEYDVQAPMGSLGHLLGVNQFKIQQRKSPYLLSDHSRRQTYRSELVQVSRGCICGLAWFSKNERIGKQKSLRLMQLEPVLRLPGVEFVNLQYGPIQQEQDEIQSQLGIRLHEIQALDVFNDIDGLLALIDACDLILTTSNVTAHLAGALGKKAAILVPYGNSKIWYWHVNDEQSLWYPSMHMIYQDSSGDWSSAIEQATEWVKANI